MADIDELKDVVSRQIKGPKILLGSGTYFDFTNPEGSEITIEDVAYALAFECRFAGQCVQRLTGRRVFYSVAEHCWRMSHAVVDEGRPDLALAALMHEAGEGPCGDMTGPLKLLCPDYKTVEKRCERAILTRFGVEITDPDAIKFFDLRMLATERRDLMPWAGEDWEFTKGAAPFLWSIDPLGSNLAAHLFLNRYAELKDAPHE